MRQRGSLRIVCAVAVLIEACCAWAPARRVHGRLQSAASRRNRFALMAAYGGDAPYAEACYDPAAAEAYFGARPLESLRRLLELAWTSAGFVANVAIDKKLGREEAMAARRSEELLDVVTRLGTTSIKVGQALSIRGDLVPAAYVAGLTKLQAHRRAPEARRVA